MEVFIGFENNPLHFSCPAQVISCRDPARLPGCFSEIEQALARGMYAAGFVSYEAGYCFEECLRQDKEYDFPLLMMGLYERPAARARQPQKPGRFWVDDFCLNSDFGQYASHIKAIRGHIARGDVYQITYCVKFHFDFQGDPLALYDELFAGQPVPYPAYIRTKEFDIVSLSPERFVKKHGMRLVTEPMKGTWRRGRNPVSDKYARIRFAHDRKNRAENLMITDLLRNDLGRIGDTVRVPKLFTVTGYNTLFQMTSTVTAEVRGDILLYELFAALFPSGSVTGAPKIRAMQIIKELEQEERKIYTGAIGYIAPDRSLYFNVPIRTLLIQGGKAEMGVGGGIVWDSTAKGEWNEGLLKASFLTRLGRGRSPRYHTSEF
ncbi:MAG: aminodeoxychorismate synthase component I [Candidatus Omnitrophica bacterium]|nr:aminodeoxychorismate synthase component I [Candidatus Omnitrophota bacterium]